MTKGSPAEHVILESFEDSDLDLIVLEALGSKNCFVFRHHQEHKHSQLLKSSSHQTPLIVNVSPMILFSLSLTFEDSSFEDFEAIDSELDLSKLPCQFIHALKHHAFLLIGLPLDLVLNQFKHKGV
jgi:hypothetical protein